MVTGWELLSLLIGVGIGASWQWVKPDGVMDLHCRLETALREIARLDGSSNVVPFLRWRA